MSDPDDLAAVRAEGRRLLAAATEGPWHQMAAAAWSGTNEDPNLVADCPLYADAIAIVWLRNNADALLADPAPVGLTEVRINIAGDALMTAWAIIANAWEGDWSQAPDEWRAAAERWRDEDFHPLLDALQEDDHD